MNMMHWAENGRLNDWLIRFGIRRLLKKRLRQEDSKDASDRAMFRQSLAAGPITTGVHEANEQHYEVPASLFETVLGSRLKYSCCVFEDGDDLTAAEARTLELTCQRAELSDGQRILELGCGWGSLTLWMAEHYPDSEIVAVSNSASQKAFIESRLRERQLSNVTIHTSDISEFDPDGKFDRVVSVEMFEHVRNHGALMDRVANWLGDEGKLFVHIFCHREHAYLFEDRGPNDWMAREFFTGGIMPSYDLLAEVAEASGTLRLEDRWKVSGTHYQATSEAWLEKLDENREQAGRSLRDAGFPDVELRIQRWRMFFMACAELFGFEGGQQWHVGHYRFAKSASGHRE